MTQKQKAERRLKIIEEVVKEGKSVAQVCKTHKISRTIFYRWKARYDQSSPGERLKALEDKKRVIERYPRQVSKEYERLILDLALNYPQFGVRRITQSLPLNGENEPIVGYHGAQRTLERNNLNTFEKRLAFQSGYLFQESQKLRLFKSRAKATINKVNTERNKLSPTFRWGQGLITLGGLFSRKSFT